jgi:dolichyl-diphosphooligosaccharide--protein glycosyltransferase/undecaprenyl-diphosphooligosaccharide--protein glycosyltransferase
MNQNKSFLNQVTTGQMLGLMLLAYIFSFLIRMIWVYQFQDNPNFFWNGQLMINTNDGYFFASGAQKELFGLHTDNPRVFGMWDYGVIFFTTLLTKITPFSLETITLYMPAIVSSLVVVPIMLIARLYGQSLWGFFAALLGSIVWSYYNRTMIGYYDTDMFSAMAPMFILFFLMKSTMDFNLRSALYAAITIAIYPFLYDAGLSVVYAMGIMYTLYMIFYHRNEKITYFSLILIFVSLLPFPLPSPYSYIVKIMVLIILYMMLEKSTLDQKKAMLIAAILFIAFLFFGNVIHLVLGKITNYVSTGTKESGLHFYSVVQTVREAGKVLFFPVAEDLPYKANIAHRMMGSSLGLIAALIGYIFLVIRKREFILALPLIGIGIFAHWGGLRFTVYAVPVAAMSATYLFFVLGDLFKDNKLKYLFVTLATASMIYPNVQHIIDYKVPTVLNKAEVQDLAKLDSMADAKDYTLAWWDYGYPIWYYSNTSTLIDGGKHNNDNFLISTILQTSSPELAANLSRLAVETYVNSKYAVAADVLFKNGQKDQLDPNLLLSELENGTYPMPKKTRDIYLYLPYRMMNIFPTVAVFGNLDLLSGHAKRKIAFYPTSVMRSDKGIIALRNGIIFDAQKGEVTIGQQKKSVKNFVITENTKEGKIQLQSQLYHMDGEYCVVYMKSYGQFIVMDSETFHSTYVQMFILGKYNTDLFELVVSSPYSKIYKLKR